MSSDLILRAVAGFRLVTADPELLTSFYRAIGFKVVGTTQIPISEMTILGLEGSGWRHSLMLGDSRLDLDSFDLPGQAYP